MVKIANKAIQEIALKLTQWRADAPSLLLVFKEISELPNYLITVTEIVSCNSARKLNMLKFDRFGINLLRWLIIYGKSAI